MKRATISDAPKFLNTNDKAFWVTGWNECVAEAEAAVKQARIDALEEAKQAVSAEEILDAEDNADDAYNCGVLDCVRAVEKLKGKTP